jgi:hypothetical protein
MRWVDPVCMHNGPEGLNTYIQGGGDPPELVLYWCPVCGALKEVWFGEETAWSYPQKHLQLRCAGSA